VSDDTSRAIDILEDLEGRDDRRQRPGEIGSEALDRVPRTPLDSGRSDREKEGTVMGNRAGRLLAFGFALASTGWAQSTERASVDSAEAEGNGHSYTGPEIDAATSADGRYAAFTSQATNLVAGDTNETRDVFVRDRVSGITEIVSVSSSEELGDGESFDPSISADGRYVAFTSHATNLVPGPTNGTYDVYVRDRQTGTTARVSVDSAGAEGNFASTKASLSADGRYVAFQSLATNLVSGDTNGATDAFVHDRQTAATERVSLTSAGGEADAESLLPSISSDGRYVAFESAATDLVAGDTNGMRDVFVRDRQVAATEWVSVSSTEAQADGDSTLPTISSDGRYVVFESLATDLVSGDTNTAEDVFLRDRQSGTTERVSLGSAGAQANGDSFRASVSAGGRWVAFTSAATNLVADDTNGGDDIFVRDLPAGTTERVSVQSDGSQAAAFSEDAWITPDGRYVVFTSLASNLVPDDANGAFDVFLRDRVGGPDGDLDDDGVPDGEDNCPDVPNEDQANADGDDSGDACDACTDTDDDGFGDPGFPGNTCPADGCPADPAKSSPGQCGCGVPDTDTDGDGTADCNDGCPADPAKVEPGQCGCGVPDADTDGDGAADCVDGCPNDPAKIAPGECGCGVPDADTDGDGAADCVDGCPSDPAKIAPGECGCGVPDADTDGDGAADCVDGCPNDPAKIAPGECGCGVPDTDTDGDGAADCVDGCPGDPAKIAPGACGCGVPDTDTDGDGAADCVDGCPNDPAKIAPGACGCGVPDTDGDGDGTADCVDNCPYLPNPGQEDLDGDGDGDACDNCVEIGNPDQGDCDDDGTGDVCEIAAGAPDCNANEVPDACDIASRWSFDRNGNGIPDECEQDGGTPFCFGNTERICPCANPSAPAELAGCRNSSGFGGTLVGSGSTSVSADGLVLSGSQLPGSLAVWFQGSGVSSHTYGDGHRCIGGTLIRLGFHNPVAGNASFPVGSDPKISVKGQVPAAGGPRYYQLFYRNLHGPCDSGTNITNGVSVVWLP